MKYILVVLAWFPAKSSYVPPISQATQIRSFSSEGECWQAWTKLAADWHKTSSEIQIAGSCLQVKE